MNGLGGSCDVGADPLRTLLEDAKWLGNTNPWKITIVYLTNFAAKEGFKFNLAEEILEFLSLFASDSLKQLELRAFHANALVSITHEGFFNKLPDLEELFVAQFSGGFLL